MQEINNHVHSTFSVIERRILYALLLKLIAVFGKGERLIGFVEKRRQIPILGKLKEVLFDFDNSTMPALTSANRQPATKGGKYLLENVSAI